MLRKRPPLLMLEVTHVDPYGIILSLEDKTNRCRLDWEEYSVEELQRGMTFNDIHDIIEDYKQKLINGGVMDKLVTGV